MAGAFRKQVHLEEDPPALVQGVPVVLEGSTDPSSWDPAEVLAVSILLDRLRLLCPFQLRPKNLRGSGTDPCLRGNCRCRCPSPGPDYSVLRRTRSSKVRVP